jgi:kynurenine formamidase
MNSVRSINGPTLHSSHRARPFTYDRVMAQPLPIDLPMYDELPVMAETGMRHAWGVFGEDDRVGTMNLLGSHRVLGAMRDTRTGEVISLDLPMNLPHPPLFGRQAYEHHVFPLNRHEMDDRVDNFHLQGSTQWDALGHVRCREFGFWGGRTENPTSGANDLGIEQWAERGIVGRGVLLDVARWAAANGQPFDALTPRTISADDLESTMTAQGVELRGGDILCVRTGWVGDYLRLDASGRQDYAASPVFAGLAGSESTARFLWDHHVAAIVCDNPAVEVVPVNPVDGSLHRRLIPLLGFALGEMFNFETLAERCRAAHCWTFLFTAAPLKIPGALGSPGNALAIL